MARRNRATPLGDIVQHEARGLVFGNRGCLHDEAGELRRRFAGTRWIACRLRFRGRRRDALMMPGRYTELFFTDDASAMAAGHRACAECRRKDFVRLSTIWAELHPGEGSAGAIDVRLHAERVGPRGERRRQKPAPLAELPDGSFVLGEDGAPLLVRGDALYAWTPAGYAAPRRRPTAARLEPITPPSLVEVLRAGWDPVVPLVHRSARG